jgi:hypothetical protein
MGMRLSADNGSSAHLAAGREAIGYEAGYEAINEQLKVWEKAKEADE